MHEPSVSQSLLRLDCFPARPAQQRGHARRHAAVLGPAQYRHGDARGLEVSPSSLPQNELIQRQIGNPLAQPAVLELKVLQALHLLGIQPTELLTPPIIRHLAHPDLTDCDETRTSTCRNFATISSGLYRFFAITVLLDVKDILQVGPFQWGRRINRAPPMAAIIGYNEHTQAT
jgi:hypothetical protein